MKHNLIDENWVPHNSPEAINEFIQESKVDTNLVSDGYHTFWELYKHRIHLFVAFCKQIQERNDEYPTLSKVIKSRKHFDWSEFEWWFIIQLETSEWQISYHLPNEYWYKCDFIETKERANKWDWHTSDDVLERLLKI